MKKLFKLLTVTVVFAMLLSCFAISSSAATINPGKTYFGSLMGERGAGFKFYYSTTPKTESPLENRVALNMLIMNKSPWPWPDGMNYYAEKADGTNAIVGISTSFNGITLSTYIKDDAIRRPMIAFTASADGEYTFSMSARLLWSPTEIGLEVWAGGVKTDKYFVVESGGNFTGTVYLNEGEELVFATVNHAWGTAENTVLIQELQVKYEGDPNAPASTEPTPPPADSTEPTPPEGSSNTDTEPTPPVSSSNTGNEGSGNVGGDNADVGETTDNGEDPVVTTSPETTDNKDDGGKGPDTALIIGIVAAVVVAAAIVTVIVIKKRK